MPQVLMTFDLKGAEEQDYERGYEALVRCGLSRVSKVKKLRLPYSSVFGTTTIGTTATEIRDALNEILTEACGRQVERIMVAVVSDWACTGYPDNDLWLEELLTRFEAMTG